MGNGQARHGQTRHGTSWSDVPLGHASLGFVPGRWPKHCTTCPFPCRDGLESTTKLAGCAGPWPASTVEGNIKTEEVEAAALRTMVVLEVSIARSPLSGWLRRGHN